MAQVIVEVYRGIVDGLHSNSIEDLHVRVFDSDDKNDPDRNHLYAAYNYAINHGGMVDHMDRASEDERHLMEEPLIRPSEALSLIPEDNQSPIQDGGDRQRLDAAFAAGYLQAVGELNVFLQTQAARRADRSHEVYQFLARFIDRQYGRYFDFCEDINAPSKFGPIPSKGGTADDEVI